jgi:hypothetical protein
MQKMKSSRHGHDIMRGFMEEEEIDAVFTDQRTLVGGKGCFYKSRNRHKILDWFQSTKEHALTAPHMELLPGSKELDCDHLVDRWMKWAYTLPGRANPITLPGIGYGGATVGTENIFLFKEGEASAYFTAVSPFKHHDPDVIRIFITENNAPLLVPIYFVETSKQENPSLNTQGDFLTFIKKDLCGIKELEATYDDEEIFGCCVIRKEPLEIGDIPRDNIIGIPEDRLKKNSNKIGMYHGGLWLLLNPEKFKYENDKEGMRVPALTKGDHLLYFKATSVNYEVEAKIQISVLV